MTLLRDEPAVGAGPPPTTGAGLPALVAEGRSRPLLRRLGLLVLAAIPLALFGVLFFYPVAVMIGRGLFTAADPVTGQLAGSVGDVLGRPRFRRILGFTLWQAGLSAGLCLMLGLPGAFLLYRRRFRGRAALRALVTVPFVLPTVVVALAFRTLFATDGLLGSWGWDGSLAAILAAHVCLNYAVVVRTVGIAWANQDDRPAEAARSLGAGPVRVFLTVTLPALGPAVAGAAVMVFLFCATSFGIMLIMGGSRYSTLETEIYHQTEDLLDLRTAAVLSVVQILLVTAVLLVAGRLRRRSEVTLRLRPAAPKPLRVGDFPALLITAATTVLVLGPIVVMLVRSLRTPQGWGLANYRALTELGDGNVLLVPVTTALVNSLRTAALAAVVSVVIGVMLSVVLARRPRARSLRRLTGALDAVVMLPLGVSAVTVGFGFLIALDKPPLDLRASAWLVPLAQALVTIPLVVRMLLPVLRAADPRLRQAAAVLGAGPVRVWLGVDLPIMSRALAGASAFALAVALGEFGATSFLARPQTATLPVEIAKLISRPGAQNTGMALAAASVLALLCVAVVATIDGLVGDRRGGIGGF